MSNYYNTSNKSYLPGKTTSSVISSSYQTGQTNSKNTTSGRTNVMNITDPQKVQKDRPVEQIYNSRAIPTQKVWEPQSKISKQTIEKNTNATLNSGISTQNNLYYQRTQYQPQFKYGNNKQQKIVSQSSLTNQSQTLKKDEPYKYITKQVDRDLKNYSKVQYTFDDKDKKIIQLEQKVKFSQKTNMQLKNKYEPEILSLKEKRQQLTTKNKDMQESLRNYNRISDQLSRVTKQKEGLQQQLQVYKGLNKNNMTYINQPIRQQKSTRDIMNEQYKQQENKKNREALTSLKLKCDRLQQELRKKSNYSSREDNKQVENLKKNNINLQVANDSLKKTIEQLNSNKTKQQLRISTLRSQISKLQKQVSRYEMQKHSMEKKNQTIQDILNQTKRQLELIRTEFQQLTNQHEILSNDYAKLKDETSDLKKNAYNDGLKSRQNSKLIELQQTIKQLARERNNLTDQLMRSNEQSCAIIEEISNLKTKNQQLIHERQKQCQIINELTIKLKQSEEKSNKIQFQRNKHISSSVQQIINTDILCFHGDILRNSLDNKNFIRQTIQRKQNIKIKDTKLIYSYDKISKDNFHKYIDDKEQIVLIIQLTNGSIIAGYYEGAFKPKEQAKKNGILMGVNNRKVYHIAQGKRAITNDDYYVIFGNSQLRLRTQQRKVFSNFGFGTGYYATNGDNVAQFLGGQTNERQIQITHYEFFQLLGNF